MAVAILQDTMAVRPQVPSSEAVVAHYEQSAEKRVRARRLIWGILIGFVLLLMLTPLVLYLAWQARGRAVLRAQVDAITAQGEPLTTTEMSAWHVVPEGTRDITSIWVVAIKPFESPAYQKSIVAVPIIGSTGNPLPPLDQPIPAADEQMIRAYLAANQHYLAALYAAADEEGEVRYSRDFSQGIAMLLPEAQQLRSAANALKVEFQILAREDDLDPAIENVETRIAAAETLRHEPLMISMLVRIAILSSTLDDIRKLAATGKLDDAQLARLQQSIRGVDIHAQLPDTLLGERAWCYHAFHNPISYSVNPSPQDLQDAVRHTTHDVQDVGRPEDCAMAMRMLTEWRAAAQEPLPAILDAGAGLEKELMQLRGEEMSLNRFRYMLTLMLMPAIHNIGQADARGEVLVDLTDASLAVRRYQLAHGKPPASWDELVPDLLPQTPIDAFDGQPLRFLSQKGSALIYSIGKDRTDNGGESDDSTLEPDIAVEVKLPAGE